MATTCTTRGYNFASASGTTLDVTGVTIASGSSLVVLVGSFDSGTTISSVQADPGGSPESCTAYVTEINASDAIASVWRKHNSAGHSSVTVTVTWDSSITDRWAAVLELSNSGTFQDDTSASESGNVINVSITTDASVTQSDCVAVSVLSVQDTITAAGGDTDTMYGLSSGATLNIAGAYEVHSAASGTLTAQWTNARAQAAAVIAVFYPETAALEANATTATASCGAFACTVVAGAVTADAGLAACDCTAFAATVVPGAVTADAVTAQASADAFSPTVAPGVVTADAVTATAEVDAMSPVVYLGHPPTKLHHIFGDSGIHRLAAGMEINSQTEYPTGQYNADAATATAWPAKGYGNDLAIAGSGDDPTPNQGSPGLGSQDDSVLYGGDKYHQASGTTFGNVGTNDLVPEVFFKCVAGPAVLFAKRNAGVGYEVGIDSSDRLYLTIEDSGGAVTVVSAVLTVNKYYYGVCFADRSGSAQWYVNAAVSGSPVAISSYTGTLDSSTSFTIGADSGGNSPYDGNVCYVSLRHASAWLDTHLQVNVAEERAWKLAGIWPELAQGTARPNTHLRDQSAFLEKIEGSEIALYGMGANLPRIQEQDDKNGRRIRGYKTEDRDDENLCLQSCDFNTTWAKVDGGDSVSANGTEAPNKQDEGDGLIADSTDGQHGFSQSVTTVASTKYVFSVWVKPGNNDWVLLRNFTDNEGKYFNASTGAKGSDLGSPDASYIRGPFKGGWYRCEIVTTTAGTSTQFIAYSCAADNDATFAGTGSTVNTWFWGAQIETNKMNRASSLLVTTTASVGRETEDLQMKMDDGNMGGVGSDLQGVWEAQILLPDCSPTSGSYHYLFRLTDGGVATNRFECWANTADGYIKWRSVTGGGISGDCSKATNVYDGAVHHVQGRWKPNVFVLAVDGSDSADGYTSAPPDDQDELDIGCTNADQFQFSGLIANLNFWQILEAYPATAQVSADAKAATAQSLTTVDAELATADTTAFAATVTPGAVTADAVLAQAQADALAATVSAGAVTTDAVLAQAQADAFSATVAAGAVTTDAVLATAQTDAFAATVVPGAVTVDAVTATAQTTSFAATIDTSVQTEAVTATAQTTSFAATVTPGAVTADAVTAQAEADAIAATVVPGAVTADAVTAQADADAFAATAETGGTSVDAVTATAQTTAFAATVTPGAVTADAVTATAETDAPAATVSPGAVTTDAATATAETTAFAATVTPGTVTAAAQTATAQTTSFAMTVTPGAVQTAALLATAQVTSLAATAAVITEQLVDLALATLQVDAFAAEIYRAYHGIDLELATAVELSIHLATTVTSTLDLETHPKYHILLTSTVE